MANQKSVKFYGDVVKRVLVVFQKGGGTTYKNSDYQFIKTRFNALRNYREFSEEHPVEIIKATSDNLPDVTTLGKGDACLFVGYGRVIDKASYDFTQNCLLHSIPVFFIRTNSVGCDSRTVNSQIWKTPTLVVKIGSFERRQGAPDKYFMQIPTIDDLILSNWTNDNFYALFPVAVPAP